MNERLEALVSGRVQMVMFRDFVCRKAGGLSLTGEVRNLPDGTVAVIAEGTRAHLEKLVEHLHRGPLLASVKDVQVSWKPATGSFNRFTLRYD